MPFNIKNTEVEWLIDEVAALTGETKTEAIRQALMERRARLRSRIGVAERRRRLRRFLETEVWSRVPITQLGKPPDRQERERILGYSVGGM